MFFSSLQSAFGLIFSFNPELIKIVEVSLNISFFSTLFAAVLGIPLGCLIVISANFPGKDTFILILNTLLALPTVVVGLLVYSVLSRQGIFGSFQILYTQKAIIVGQVILILPIVTTLTISAISRLDSRYKMTALTLGASKISMFLLLLREAKFAVLAAVITAFGRVVAEIGISMMLGGNIKGFTRTMTTAMALEYDKGEFVLSMALGIVLLFISLFLNFGFRILQGRCE